MFGSMRVTIVFVELLHHYVCDRGGLAVDILLKFYSNEHKWM